MRAPTRLEIAGMTPVRVESPEDERQAAELLAATAAAGEGAVPAGGATVLQTGNPPERYDLAVTTDRLTGIVEYNPEDLTVVVRAGTTLVELDRVLAEHGQFLPVDAPHPERATVGGTLASNPGGLWRARYGAARDLTIGMRVALSTGEVAKSGGKVVKNVAGYDLSKLIIGSFGTLGVIVEAAFKVYPRPAGTRAFFIPTGDLAAALSLGRKVRSAGSTVLVSTAVSETLAVKLDLPGAGLFLLLGGTPRALDDVERAIRGMTDGAVTGIEDSDPLLAALGDMPGSAVLKVGTKPTDLDAVLDGERPVLAYPGIGLAYVGGSWTAEEVRTLREQVSPTGHVTLWQGGAHLLREVDAWGSLGSGAGLVAQVKRTFDPAGALAPGRLPL